MTLNRAAYRVAVVLVVLACAARLIHLDADPSIPTWIGYVTDEGRWTETARNLALFGAPDLRGEVAQLHFLLSPGYQATNFLLFRLFGVDFLSARLLAAISGCLIVLVSFLALRRHLSPLALTLGVMLLGFDTEMLALSRLALPEIPSAFASLVAFLLIALGRDTRWQLFLAGIFAAAAVAFKGTSAPIVLVLLFVILVSPHGGPDRRRWPQALCFLTGVGASAVVTLAVPLALGLFHVARIGDSFSHVLHFLSVSGLYTIVARFFDSPELEARNLMLLGGWFCSWIWIGRAPRTSSLVSKLYLMSGCWAGAWLLLWSGNTYLPGRYLVHFIVPATIHIMAGLSLGQRDTLARIGLALRQRKGPARAVLLTWLVVPSAIIAASVITGLAAGTGLTEIGSWSISRLSVRLVLIAALTGLLAPLAKRATGRDPVAAAFLLFPIMMTVLWLSGRAIGLFRFFWRPDSAVSSLSWIAVMALALATILFLLPRLRTPHVMVQSFVILVLAAILLAQAAPAIVSPSFSIRDASRDLEHYLADAKEVRSVFAGSFFIENKLKYREVLGPPMDGDGIVVVDQHARSGPIIRAVQVADLAHVRTYPVMISPAYRTSKASVTIYRRRVEAASSFGGEPPAGGPVIMLSSHPHDAH